MSKGGCPYCGSTSYMWIKGVPKKLGWFWIKTKNIFYKGNEKTEPQYLYKIQHIIELPFYGDKVIAYAPIQEPEE